METPPPGWLEVPVPFAEEHPVWVRNGPRAESPLLVLCHGMSQGPAWWLGSAPRLLALPVHLLLPAGPYPHEVRRGNSFRIGHAWYLYDGGPDRFRNTVDRSAAWLLGAVKRMETERGWTPSRRILVGYSQGAYFAYVASLRAGDVVSHLVAVAGRLKEDFLAEELSRPGPLRTLILHGAEDDKVSSEAARRSHQALVAAGFPAELRILPGGHAFSEAVDAEAAGWIRDQALSL